MRNPIDVLKLLTEKASVKGYTFERLYRNLYNPDFYLLAYKNIAASPGSMTTGADGLSIDNMSMARINKIIVSLKDQTYQPNPARRTYIAKKNNPTKKRPLGIPSTNDKLVQEVIRMLLEAIYEPTFSNLSHGFRPKRSCHTALSQIKDTFTGVRWMVEGDIKACFRIFQTPVNQGFFDRPQRVGGTFILYPHKSRFNCVTEATEQTKGGTNGRQPQILLPKFDAGGIAEPGGHRPCPDI